MKKSFLLLAALVATITARADSAEYTVDLSSFTGTNSWANTETFWNSHAAAGFLEIGGEGTGTTSGSAYLEFGEDLDLTQGAGHSIGSWTTLQVVDGALEGGSAWYDTNRVEGVFNLAPSAAYYTTTNHHYVYLECVIVAAAGNVHEPFRITFTDADDATAYWQFDPPSGYPGMFITHQGTTRPNIPEYVLVTGTIDWQRVRKITISGTGGSSPFHAAFKGLRIRRHTYSATGYTNPWD